VPSKQQRYMFIRINSRLFMLSSSKNHTNNDDYATHASTPPRPLCSSKTLSTHHFNHIYTHPCLFRIKRPTFQNPKLPSKHVTYTNSVRIFTKRGYVHNTRRAASTFLSLYKIRSKLDTTRLKYVHLFTHTRADRNPQTSSIPVPAANIVFFKFREVLRNILPANYIINE
jgi:hypothetical protein